ncbi:MAG: ankyrin repeat domain-containing protein [Verrucomicrobia bacterium]|nr:ankyrin repeat domain-containing protein [Verrucomicrobiota bacterium]MCG2681820.1 ankyrin repeat domain-containing protein [Kiritimatiellia bacterium]MBU4247702.1 ankyrin repeat domain-containing protein [Verrucomicrobiota bacterium]MBU4291647.1 ankyrin repeat domain-containing protein [Verrucomicrobiota bacterium]MBU4429536.1 ankyrin repeat domain-containing protein [Verrucomicrobiota bacterium]
MKHAILLATGLGVLTFITAGFGNEMILEEAIVHNNLPAVSNYIASGISVNTIEGNDGQTALHIAAGSNRKEMAQFLIAKKADINARDHLGMTPLHWAAYKGHQEMVVLLLKHNAEINTADIHGLTPLHLATTYGHDNIITLLLDYGANLNARTYDQGMTPIHWAAFCGHTEGLKPLLKHGADINTRDNEGNTPLTWAEEYLHVNMARLIARKGGKRHIN